MAYCIYLRKSRQDIEAERGGDEETLARHKRTLIELARRMHYDVAEIYHEVVSGETIAQRPEMRRLLGDVQAGIWEGVLVMEIERLARGDTMDQGLVAQTFKYSGTLIVTPLKVYDPSNEFDEEYFEFSLFMSRREYKTIRRRQEAGKEAACKEGRWVYNVTPYGYTRVRSEDGKGFRLEPDPEQAPILKSIFDWYVHGDPQPDGTLRRLGVSLICRKLNSMGVPTKTGNCTWVTATIRDILRNQVYTGKIRRGRRAQQKHVQNGQIVVTRPRKEPALYDGLHEPLVPPEVFAQAQEYLAVNRPAPIPDRGTLKNPLAGLIVCGMCGRRMVRRPYQSGRKPSLICYDTACKNVSADFDIIEARLLERMRDWLEQYKVEKKSPCTLSDASERAAAAKLEEEFDLLSKQRDEAYRLLERGIYSEDEFFERRAKVSEAIDRMEGTRKELVQAIEEKRKYNELAGTLIPRWEQVLTAYETATITEKNAMVKEVLEKVVYTREESGRFTGIYDNFTLELFPKLPK